jgi:hypothetical protein
MECPFVLIHSETTYFPTYVNTCIKQIRTWNPTATIVFITNSSHKEKVTESCEFIALEDIPMGQKRNAFHSFSPVWRYTMERLFILEDYLQMSGINECVHLNNNTMVYFSLKDMLPILRQEYKGLAAPYLGKGEMSFSILYVKQAITLSEINYFILSMSHTTDNEVRLGCRYFLENSRVAGFLPTVSDECEIRDDDYYFATSHGEAFRGVWDAAPYGQFLGEPSFVNKTAAFASDQFTYEWRTYDDGLKHPRAHRHGHSWPIYILTVVTLN